MTAIRVQFHTPTLKHTHLVSTHTLSIHTHTHTSGRANFVGYFRDAIFVFASFCFCTCCNIFIACSHIAPLSLLSLPSLLCFCCFLLRPFCCRCRCLCTFIDGSYCSLGVLFCPIHFVPCQL